MKIAVGNSRMDKKWKNRDISWEDLCARCGSTIRTTETVEEYRKLKKGAQDSIKDVGGFVGGALREGRRKNGMVLCRSMLTLDMDYGKPGIWDEVDLLHDFKCCVYSTHKHTPENPRLRMIIPLSREITEEEYPAVARMVAKEIGIDLFDDTTYEACRLMYWPSTSTNGAFFFQVKDGEVLNPDAYLAKYDDWHDASTWPVSSRQSEAVRRSISQQADPLTKPGVVGAFCRAYTIEEAIDTFLPEVYAPSAMNGRYDYIPADSSAGVVLYDGKFAYSHHATDPVCGKLLNAFDLVRLHKFRDQDENCSLDTPMGKLPSFKAMTDFTLRDEKVKAVFAEERQAQANQEFEDADWQNALELDKAGKVKDTLTNICTILRYDTNLKGIVFNQFKSMLDVVSPLPWPQVKPGWGDTDVACAKLYFEKAYGIWSPTKFKDALLAVTSSERLYHPVKEYLAPLKWDGVPRLDTLLIDYLGAEDTPYVRAVTRKTLVAAVARIYRPGVKFDSILVLNGSQGIGKSTLFALLGKEWFSDSLSISDMKDKTAPEKLQGYWLLELSELNGIKKVDVEVVKSFITRTDDKYRQAYGTTVESHPRSCIIVGTTNSEGGFLRDITGNRRFWPVNVSGHGKYHPLELTEVDQVWAEAVEYFNRGEELFLKGNIASEAYSQQREAMETDAREGIVQEYLDRLLPEGWDKMELFERRNFLDGSEFGGTRPEGTVQRDRVCAMEIWCECFGKTRESLKKADAYEIEGILYKLGGWKKYSGNAQSKLRLTCDLVFLGVNAYQDYRSFVDWCAASASLFLIYKPYGTTEFYREVQINYLTKTELTQTRWLSVPTSLSCLTPWYRAAPIQMSMTTDTGYIMRYSYRYTPELIYSSSTSGSMAADLEAGGHIPAAFVLTFDGAIINPRITLKGASSGKTYGECSLNLTLTQGQQLALSTRYGNSYVRVQSADGSVEDVLDAVDLSKEPFPRIPTEESCTLYLAADEAITGTATVRIYYYYRSV